MNPPFAQRLVPKVRKRPKAIAPDPGFDLEGTLDFSGFNYRLEDLVGAITPENSHGEVNWGPPMGRELI
jgi:hypothetical protein